MGKKIIFKGNPYGVFQAFEPNLEQLLTLETTPYDPENDCTAYQVNLVMEHFRKKNIHMGRLTAENLCQRTSESYTIKAFNMETALPVEIVITKKEIEEILAPFEADKKESSIFFHLEIHKVFCLNLSNREQKNYHYKTEKTWKT